MNENERPCAVSTGRSKRFATEKDAVAFLAKQTNSGEHNLEAVCCSAPLDGPSLQLATTLSP